jgi:hypothetical protein
MTEGQTRQEIPSWTRIREWWSARSPRRTGAEGFALNSSVMGDSLIAGVEAAEPGAELVALPG